MEAINKNMAKGAIWMILFRFLNRSIGLISTIILARLLVPADFGLVALATAMAAAVELLGAFNMDVVLIQNQEAERRHYDTAWTINVLMGFVLAAIMVISSSFAASFYSEPRLQDIIYLLAVGAFFQKLQNIGVVEFQKRLVFHKDFYFRLAIRLSAFATTVTLAILFRNYWALVIGSLVSRILGVALSYWVQPYRPRFSLAAWRELFHFSKWLFINNSLAFVNTKSGDFIIGMLSGPHGLGVYSLGYEISNLTSTELVAPINRAIFPGYAKLAHSVDALRQAFLNVTGSISLFALPVGVGIAIVADPLVHLLLGEKWLETIPVIQILAFSGIAAVIQASRTYIFLALGRPRIVSLLAVLQDCVLLPALIVGVRANGVSGAAWAILVVGIALLPVNYSILFNILRLRPATFAAVLWRPVLATAAMGLAVKLLLDLVGKQDGILGWAEELLLAGVAGGLIYGGFVMLLWRMSGSPRSVETVIMGKVMQHLKTILNGARKRSPAA